MTHVRQPAEWTRHHACWLAWPSHADLWLDQIEDARAAFVDLCAAIARSERLEILVLNTTGETEAREALGHIPARYHHIPFGDIWLRDTGPVFVAGDGVLEAARFKFNGWGGKYVFDNDPAVAPAIAAVVGARLIECPIVFEGGAIDVDGEGTGITTRQCLLDVKRNPRASEDSIAAALRDALGVDHLLWLERGLVNDHTDGHVDTLARFVAPGVVACMDPADADDPNRETLRNIARDLATFRDVSGQLLDVVTIPSPGRIEDRSGEVLPASYLNFYIANDTVVVPSYESRHDDDAIAAIDALFPGRHTVSIDARAILTGGGAFHCITQQQPEPS